MLKTTAIAIAAAALMLGAASTAHASKDDSGDYKGGFLYGPLPGQVFGHAWRRGRALRFARGGRAYGYGYGYGYVYAPRFYAPRAYYHRVAR